MAENKDEYNKRIITLKLRDAVKKIMKEHPQYHLNMDVEVTKFTPQILN